MDRPIYFAGAVKAPVDSHETLGGVVASTVVLLDDSKELLTAFSRLLRVKHGIECLCYSHFADLVAHSEEVLCNQLAILDINLGPNEPNGIEAFEWLTMQGFRGKILFLTGHAQSSPLVEKARLSGVEVLEKPIASDRLLSIIKGAAGLQ